MQIKTTVNDELLEVVQVCVYFLHCNRVFYVCDCKRRISHAASFFYLQSHVYKCTCVNEKENALRMKAGLSIKQKIVGITTFCDFAHAAT